MIQHPAFMVEPWRVREQELHLDVLAQTESVFALANGHVGLRGNLDEGEPFGLPGSYLNSFHELRRLPYPEPGYGDPRQEQRLVNVTNGKLIRLLVDDEPFDVRYGTLQAHERVLDLREGVLRRMAVWRSPAGATVRVESTRLVSFTQRAVAAICYQVQPVEAAAQVVVQSELVANETMPKVPEDPRRPSQPAAVLRCEYSAPAGTGAVMVHRTEISGLRMAAAMAHEIDSAAGVRRQVEADGDVARLTVAARLRPGQRLRLVKYLAYGWSARRSRAALRDQVLAALAAARLGGFDGLRGEQRGFLDDFWSDADVEIDGDPEVQQAVRFGLFHVLQAAARGEQRPIPAKGLTGPGYEGHTFWDTEAYVLPVLMHTYPAAAGDPLRWRRSRLPAAAERARQFGLAGAMFPWRTIDGQECSGYWPASTAALHINADIAYAATAYVAATADEEFERDTALPLLVATARLWVSAGHYDPDGRFRIDGVTGPDEYSALADNNVYTNLMARRNLTAAAETAARHRRHAQRLGVTEAETAIWRRVAGAMVIPYDERLGVHPQSEGFTNHAEWDFTTTGPDQYPLMLHYPYFELYRRQVIKQADLVLAMHRCPEAFTPEQKSRNVAYYEARTVRDSSLSAATQAVLAAEVGHLDLAHRYLGEAALIDLANYAHNTRDGMHLASLAGAWTALVAGLGGMRLVGDQLTFAPRLPDTLAGVAFRVRHRHRRLKVTIDPGQATYQLLAGPPLTIGHHGRDVHLADQPVTLEVPRVEPGPPPAQPPGRAPAPRPE